VVLANHETLVCAAREAAERFGLRVERLLPPATDNVADVAARYETVSKDLPQGTLLLGGGEPTVVLTADSGLGGRSQHLALLMARAIRRRPLAFLAAGSDGSDGPTDAAGALVTGRSWDQALQGGLNPDDALRSFDSCRVHANLGTHIVTGPTQTNLLDLHMLAMCDIL